MAGMAMWFGFPLVAMSQDIVIGQIGPFTVLPVPDAAQANQGIKAYLAQANKAGGVNGRKISFFELDDAYSADNFVKRFDEAMQRKPVALITPIGSAAVKRMFDAKLLDKYDVLVMNQVPGAEAFREPGHPHLFHVRTGDREELIEIVNHARTIGITRLGVLYQNIPMGASGMKTVTEQAAKLKDMEVKGFQGGMDPALMAKAAAEVAKTGAQGFVVIGAPPFAAGGVAALRKLDVSQFIFILTDTSPGLVKKLAGAKGARGVVIAQIFPNPNGRTRPVVREFQSAMKASYPDLQAYAPFQFEGYISARILVEAMRRVKGEITPGSVAKVLHAMGEVDFGGYRVDFSKGNMGGQYVDIAVMDEDGKLRY
jgi:ABC-type branched-subunit amino acid transport system substrate-binding protein